jgi:hypothetical protein
MLQVKACGSLQMVQWRTSQIGTSFGLWQSILPFLLIEGLEPGVHGQSFAVWRGLWLDFLQQAEQLCVIYSLKNVGMLRYSEISLYRMCVLSLMTPCASQAGSRG